jgi:iduronate 2-sulfatase
MSPLSSRLPLVFQTVPLLVLGLSGLTTQGSPAEAAECPNVLLILVDDLKPALGCYGDTFAHSPNIDRLAARGLRFDRAYCNQAVCAPSRNTLLTGSRSTSLGVYDLGTNFRQAVPDAVTLPQHFKRHGYATVGVGKVFHIGHGNHGDDVSWSHPFESDKVVDYVLPNSTGGRLTREEALFSNKSAAGLPRGAAWEQADVDDDAYADGRIATRGIHWLRTFETSGESYFLALGFVKPHLPFCAPRKYWDLYDAAKLPRPEFTTAPLGAPPFAGKTLLELNQYEPIPNDPPLSEETQRMLVHGYYAALSYLDAQVGRVLDEFDRLQVSRNTIVVLWSDHGYHLGDHGIWTKHTNYEQANRIPLIIAAPGVTQPGSSTQALVESVDLFPTLCDLAGLPAPDGPQPIDGQSLRPMLTNPDATIRDHAYHCFPRGERLGRAIRTQRYRLVEWKRFGAAAESAEYELYDYETDPLETTNLARDQLETVGALAEILARHPEPRRPQRN